MMTYISDISFSCNFCLGPGSLIFNIWLFFFFFRLKTASVRLLRDGRFRPSQGLLSGYSETVAPLIQSFYSTSIEGITSIKADGEVLYQDATTLPRDNSGSGGDPRHGSRPVTKRFKNYGPNKRQGSSQKGYRHETKLPGTGIDGFSQKGGHHGTKLPGRDGSFQKGIHHEKKLPDTGFKPFLFQTVLDASTSALVPILDTWLKAGNRLESDQVNMALFHLRKQRMYNKALKVPDFVNYITMMAAVLDPFGICFNEMHKFTSSGNPVVFSI